ncbi:unnamed protein product [Rhodiola kirilowii]
MFAFLCIFILFPTFFTGVLSGDSIKSSVMSPFSCSERISICNSSLYHINTGHELHKIASLYNVSPVQMKPISYKGRKDYIITVPCSCQTIVGNGTVDNTTGYFYQTSYHVKFNDTIEQVSSDAYSGQVWFDGRTIVNDTEISIHLLCGCIESTSQVVVTYTVQDHDTLSDISALLSARITGIQNLNEIVVQNPGFIDIGWVLYVPQEKNGLPHVKPGMKPMSIIVLVTLSGVTLLSVVALVVILLKRKRQQNNQEDPRMVSKTLSGGTWRQSMQNQHYYTEHMTDIAGLETDRPVVYSLDEVAEATNDFDETKVIGVGGYGSVYLGLLKEKEVAVKKMRSNKCKEFFAELKVLCKIHHRNVVELLGYASGDDDLCLVYEYVQNGSLSDHLHDPLLKGFQPLSWTARTQIAVDAARGIEYIHDHTKSRYVHRDIKSSNILLDERLRGKVADFGLAKLVGRANEDDTLATRLVGTPGYLPPESVKELQITTKSDIFAFGVVLAELITGRRALVRDHREPTRMKSLITVIKKIFEAEDPEIALEAEIDGNLRGGYPLEDVYRMAEISESCLREEAVERPDIGEVVVLLSQVMVTSFEWEGSLGGNSQVFSGLFNGR